MASRGALGPRSETTGAVNVRSSDATAPDHSTGGGAAGGTPGERDGAPASEEAFMPPSDAADATEGAPASTGVPSQRRGGGHRGVGRIPRGVEGLRVGEEHACRGLAGGSRLDHDERANAELRRDSWSAARATRRRRHERQRVRRRGPGWRASPRKGAGRRRARGPSFRRARRGAVRRARRPPSQAPRPPLPPPGERGRRRPRVLGRGRVMRGRRGRDRRVARASDDVVIASAVTHATYALVRARIVLVATARGRQNPQEGEEEVHHVEEQA